MAKVVQKVSSKILLDKDVVIVAANDVKDTTPNLKKPLATRKKLTKVDLDEAALSQNADAAAPQQTAATEAAPVRAESPVATESTGAATTESTGLKAATGVESTSGATAATAGSGAATMSGWSILGGVLAAGGVAAAAGGGGGGGGGTPADTTAPTASVTTATIMNTANATVQSTEVGTAYLVKSTVAVTNLASITGAADNNFNSVAIATANTPTNLSAAGLVDGTYKVYTVDAAGNLSAASANTITIDTTAPTANFTSATDNVGTVIGALASGDTTDDTALALAGTCEAGSTVNVYNGATLLGAATVVGTNWTYSAAVADGTTYQFNVKETDVAGNTSVATSNFTVIGDTTAPAVITTEPTDYGVSYGPANFYAEISADGSTITITADEDLALGSVTIADFTLFGTAITVTDVEVDGTDGTKINLTLSAPIDRDDAAITITYDGGLTDLAGNELPSFSAEAVRNSAVHTEPVAATITAAKFVQLDVNADKNYIELSGTGFNQFLDSANGALDSTDLKAQFDWTNFVWQVEGSSDTNVTFTVDDIEKVNILTDGTMKIYLTDVKWNDLITIDGLGTSSSTSDPDILAISSGFLSDADGAISNATYSTVFVDTQYTIDLTPAPLLPDIYASSVFLSGTGTFNGSKLHATEVSVQVDGNGDMILEEMTQLGTLDSLKTSGTLTIQGWGNDGVTVANAGIINSGGDEIQVWVDSNNIGNNTLTNFTLLGDNFLLLFDQAAADISLQSDGSGVHNLQYIGDLLDGNGNLTVNGFTTGVDEIILDSSIFASLIGTGSPVDLDSDNFVSRVADTIAQDADDFIIYNESTGGVYYDADANGMGSSAVLLMTLTDMPSIAFDDFKVI